MSEEKAPRWTNKQKIFINEYLCSFNAAKAARAAGYSEKTARFIGQENLTKPYIAAEIRTRISESQMGADEALKRLADMARGDIGELIDNNGLLDLREARSKGLTKLIRKIKQKTITRIGKSDTDDDIEITEMEFEMYDALGAIRDILKMNGKLLDRSELTIVFRDQQIDNSND